jgi:hypothetical protein
VTVAIRCTALTALVLCGLACVVTPEPIPGQPDAGWWADGSDNLPDSSVALDLQPPWGVDLPVTSAPDADLGYTAVDAAEDQRLEDGLTGDGLIGDGLTGDGLTGDGLTEGGPGEGGPQEAGPPDLEQTD